MSAQKQLVESYLAAYAEGDVEGVLACVGDDLRWEVDGRPVARGRAAFRARLTAGLSTGRAVTTVDRLVEGAGCAMSVGRGRFVPADGGPPTPLTRIDAFVFDGDRISLLRTTNAAA